MDLPIKYWRWCRHANRRGEGPSAAGTVDPATRVVKSSPLMVNGVLYFATPDHVWAVDARNGHELWHFFWHTLGGPHVGDRGVGMYGSWFYFATPDGYLVSLDAKTGTERWHKQIVYFKQGYYLSIAPVVIGNRVLVGTSGDLLDLPGFLESRNPATGELQWRWFSEPMKKGDASFRHLARSECDASRWRDDARSPRPRSG